MTTATLTRLMESPPAMRMWKFLDNLTLIQEMQQWYCFDSYLFEAEEDPEKQHKRLLGLLQDVHHDHRKMTPEQSAAREKVVNAHLDEESTKAYHAKSTEERNKHWTHSEHQPKMGESLEDYKTRFRHVGLKKQRSGEPDTDFEARKAHWAKGHRSDGMDAKSVHSAMQLMSHPTVEGYLKGQRRRAVQDPDLPDPTFSRGVTTREKTTASKTGGKKGEALVTKTAGITQPKMSKSEKDYHDTPGVRVFQVKGPAGKAVRELRKAGRGDEAKALEQHHRDKQLHAWRKDTTDAQGKPVVAGHKMAYLDDHHGGGHKKHKPVKVKSQTAEGTKISHIQPPEGGWSKQNPRPDDSYLDRTGVHEKGLGARARAAGRGGVVEPGQTSGKEVEHGVGSAGMNSIKAGLLTGHGHYIHHYDKKSLAKAKELLGDRKAREALGEKISPRHPEVSYDAIEMRTGVSRNHLVNMHNGRLTVPIRDLAHQIRRKVDKTYEHYKSKSPAETKPEEDEDEAEDEYAAIEKEAPEQKKKKIDKVTPDVLGEYMSRLVGKRSSSPKSRRKAEEVMRWSNLAQKGKGEEGSGEGIAGLETKTGKVGERMGVGKKRHIDPLLKHPGDKPTKKSGETQEKFDERTKADREHHEELTGHLHPGVESKRKASIKMGEAARKLLHPGGSLHKKIAGLTQEGGGKGAHKGISHALPVEAQVRHHAARLLKTDHDAVLSLAQTGKAGPTIGSARASKKTGGAASGSIMGEPAKALLRKERETTLAGEKPEDKSRRPRALVHRLKGTGQEDYTREREVHDAIHKDLEHVFPTSRETLATGGEGGGAHISTLRKAHPFKGGEGKGPPGMHGTEKAMTGGFAVDQKFHGHTFDEDAVRASFNKKPPSEPKYKKAPAEPKSPKFLKGKTELTPGQQVKYNAKLLGHSVKLKAHVAEHQKKLDAHQKALESHKAEQDNHVESQRAAHNEKLDAWHSHLEDSHKKVHGVVRDFYKNYLNPDHPHTEEFERIKGAETEEKRTKREAKEKAGRIERRSLFAHHKKHAARDPKVQAALGISGESAHTHTATALDNVFKRLQQDGRHGAYAMIHGEGGVGEKIPVATKPKLKPKLHEVPSLAGRVFDKPAHMAREAERSAEPLKRDEDESKEAFKKRKEEHEQKVSLGFKAPSTTPSEVARRERRSKAALVKKSKAAEAPSGLEAARRKTAAKTFAGRVGETDIVPTAGQARGARRLPMTTRQPTKPMETGVSVAAKHAGTIAHYHNVKDRLASLRARGPSPARATAAAEVRSAHRELKSAGLDPRNLPDRSTRQRKPVAAAPGRRPRFTGEQLPMAASRAAQQRALPTGTRVTTTKRIPSETEERGKAETEHRMHVQALSHYRASKSALKSLKDDPDTAPAKLKAAQEKHDTHAATVKERGLDPSKPDPTPPSVGREAALEKEREKRAKTPPGSFRTTGRVPVRKRVGPPKPPRPTRPARPSSATPAPFKMASIMKPKPGKKLFVPTPEQRKAAVLHRTPLESPGVKQPQTAKPASVPERGSKRIEQGRPGEQKGNFERSETGAIKKAEESRLVRSSLAIQETMRAPSWCRPRQTSFFEKVCALA